MCKRLGRAVQGRENFRHHASCRTVKRNRDVAAQLLQVFWTQRGDPEALNLITAELRVLSANVFKPPRRPPRHHRAQPTTHCISPSAMSTTLTLPSDLKPFKRINTTQDAKFATFLEYVGRIDLAATSERDHSAFAIEVQILCTSCYLYRRSYSFRS